MSGYQPESQMLELWSSHRRRTVETLRPAGSASDVTAGDGVKRSLRALPILAGLLALLTGCAVYPERGGYWGRGQGYGYGHGSHGYYRGYNGYGSSGYGSYGHGGGWRHRHRHRDDDD